jgi:uncharacterized OB-fold protein
VNDISTARPKPVPIVNTWGRPFWDAAREGHLVLQRCRDCGRHVFYPRIACPHCQADALEWVEASGRGTLYSFTVVQANAPSAFARDVPYVVAVVRLDEGVQMLTNIVECDVTTLRCDQPVEVVFVRRDDEFTLPCFRPCATSRNDGATR